LRVALAFTFVVAMITLLTIMVDDHASPAARQIPV
jgi:hypothetical protein